MYDGLVGGKQEGKKRGSYRLNEAEYDFVRRMLQDGAAAMSVDNEPKAQYVRTRIREVLRVKQCGDGVRLAVRDNVVYIWLVAKYDSMMLNSKIIKDASPNMVNCAYGYRVRKDGERDMRVIERELFSGGGGLSKQRIIDHLQSKSSATPAQPVNRPSGGDPRFWAPEKKDYMKGVWKNNLESGKFTEEEYKDKMRSIGEEV